MKKPYNFLRLHQKNGNKWAKLIQVHMPVHMVVLGWYIFVGKNIKMHCNIIIKVKEYTKLQIRIKHKNTAMS